MELHEFVTLTITQVINGINKAQEISKESSAKINPRVSINSKSPSVTSFFNDGRGEIAVKEIEFDIAVQTESKNEAGATIGIVIADIGLGAKGKMKDSQSSISRIKFTVPIVFPYDMSSGKEPDYGF